VTEIRRTLHSPALAGGADFGPLRARTRARPSLGRGAGEGATLRILLEEASTRADRLQEEIGELLAAGDYRAAFNVSIEALRASLAREARRRPGEANAIYRCFAEQSIRLVRELPGLVAVEGEQ
jgi:hypothetical protein